MKKTKTESLGAVRERERELYFKEIRNSLLIMLLKRNICILNNRLNI